MSVVPEVLAALASIGAATLPGSQVINGDLSGVTVTEARLFLIGDEEFEVNREPDSLGGNTATERFTVPCSIAADVPGADQQIADQQVWADFEALDAALIANPALSLSGSFSLNAMLTAPRFMRTGDPNGRHSLIRFGVDVYAAND